MAQRKVAMVSSTARDLPEHREQVRLACERAGFAPHEMVEHLTAENSNAVEVSLRMVQEADVYIVILAYRYGYIPEGSNVSITEMEYDRAVELDKARLIFFIHENHPVTGRDIETGPGAAKLQALKDRIGKDRVAAFFESAKDLRGHVVEALTKLHEILNACDSGDVLARSAFHRKTSIPAPPEPFVAHPYLLLQSRDLIGRQSELNEMTDWVADPKSKAYHARVFGLVAIGGMGKSALAWKWFNRIAPNEMKTLAGRLWWSFYESDADFETFLIRALCYVGGESEQAVRALPWPEREARLLRHLNETPYLFVFDGLERILLAYHHMDASYLADDEYDERTANWVAGATGLPSSAAQSFTGQHRLRQTTDPRAGNFLQKLTQLANSRILITTRLYPWALQLPTGHPRPGCFAYFLHGLSDDDALGLWRTLGVSGARGELVPIFRSIEGHPLLVQTLASEIAVYRKAPGDFVQWREDHPQFDPTRLPLVKSRTHILDFALKGIPPRIREVLHTLVGFRMPASYVTLEAILVGMSKACASAQELDSALTELEDRGLIGWDRDANRYDAHPIVRGVVWQLARPEDQRAVYTALDAHFEPIAAPRFEEIKSLADLRPIIERYHTLIGLHRYDDAFSLFLDQLDEATVWRLSAHWERITWLEPLFLEGIDGPPVLAADIHKSHLLDALGVSLFFCGRPGQTIPLCRQSEVIARRMGSNFHRTQLRLSGLSDSLLAVGAMYEALDCVLRELAISRLGRDSYLEHSELRCLGWLLSIIGDKTGSQIAFSRSQCLLVEEGRRELEGVINTFLSARSLWFGDYSKAAVQAERGWLLTVRQQVKTDIIHAAELRGKVALALGNFPKADECLNYALAQARTDNIVFFELPAIIALAEVELKHGHLKQARAFLDDVWDAAERGPYPIKQADAYNVLANIELADGNKPAAIDAATKAYKAAWCNGPPYAYHWGLEKAKAHLAALDAPQPDMPHFDERKVEPLPTIEINSEDEYWVDPENLD